MKELFKKDAVQAAAVFIIALTVRAIYLTQISSGPLFDEPVGDTGIYLLAAHRILEEGFFFADIFSTSAVAYIIFLAAIISIFGSVTGKFFLAASIVQILVGSANCVLVYLLGRRLFDSTTGFIAGMMAALYGVLIFFDGELVAATFVFFFFNLSLLLTLRFESTNSRATSAASGPCLGIAALCAPNVALVFIAVPIWMLVRDGGPKEFLSRLFKGRAGGEILRAALFSAAFLAVVSPATVKNYAASGEFILISGNGGVNFFIGNNKDASGAFSLPAGKELVNGPGFYRSTFVYPERELGKELTAGEVDSYWFGEGWRAVTGSPSMALRLITKKTLLFLNSYEIPNHNNYYFFKRYGPLLELPLFGLVVVGPFFLLGALQLGRRWREYVPLLIYLIVYAASVIPFFITARYRLPVLAVVIVLAAYGVRYVYGLVKEKALGELSLALATLAAAYVLINIPFAAFHEEATFAREHLKAGNAHFRKGEVAKAEAEFLEAITLDPNFIKARANLGVVYAKGKRYDEAMGQFGAVLSMDPTNVEALTNTANVLLATGRVGDAINIYKKTLSLYPTDAETRVNLAVAYLKQGSDKEAARELREVLRLYRGHAKARRMLGDIIAKTTGSTPGSGTGQ